MSREQGNVLGTFSNGAIRRWLIAAGVLLVLLALNGALATKAAGLVGASSATLTTDKDSYTSGETVVILGNGFNGTVPVTVTIDKPDQTRDTLPLVTTDASGVFSTTYVAPGIEGVYQITATDGSNTAVTAFYDPSLGLNLDQCRNGTLANLSVKCGSNGNGAPSWAHGDVNAGNSQYREGDGLPYRNSITKLSNGTWTIRMSYDFTKGGTYAIDRLTRYSLTQASNPCASNSDVSCTEAGYAFEFEMPGEVVTPSLAQPALPNSGNLFTFTGTPPFTPGSITAADREMRVWVSGGTATFVSAGQNWTGNQATSFNDGKVFQNGSAAGDSSREFAFKVILSGCPSGGCKLAMGWTGHIASAVDWGPGEGAGHADGDADSRADFHANLHPDCWAPTTRPPSCWWRC